MIIRFDMFKIFKTATALKTDGAILRSQVYCDKNLRPRPAFSCCSLPSTHQPISKQVPFS